MARTTYAGTAQPVHNTGYLLILARLLKTENWDDMTAAANASPEHRGNLDRWRRMVRTANAGLSDEQVDRLAERLRHLYFSELGKKSGKARAARAAERVA